MKRYFQFSAFALTVVILLSCASAFDGSVAVEGTSLRKYENSFDGQVFYNARLAGFDFMSSAHVDAVYYPESKWTAISYVLDLSSWIFIDQVAISLDNDVTRFDVQNPSRTVNTDGVTEIGSVTIGLDFLGKMSEASVVRVQLIGDYPRQFDVGDKGMKALQDLVAIASSTEQPE